MWRIRRVYLDGIGARAARFRDLELDFTSERTGAPLHSLAWLRNGGGKSSLIALIGALIRPDKDEFLSATSKRRDAGGRCLGDYILDGDTGHVVIEWGEADGRRLITGAVYEWPDRQAPLDPNRDHDRLRQTRYLFVPVAGVAELDRLPFVTSGNRTQAEHFIAAVRAWSSVTEVDIPKSQADWSSRLDAHGIDSDLWRTIVEMNKTEGGIDDLFLFSNPNDFVRFLLKLIVDPKEIDPVAGLLKDVSEQLALRPDTLADLAFANGAIERLTELEHAYDDDVTAHQLVAEAEETARSLRASLRAAADIAQERSSAAEVDRTVAAAEQRENESAADAARFTALEFRRLAAIFRREAASDRLGKLSSDVAAAEDAAESWAATTDVARYNSAADRVATLRDQLTRITSDAEPLRERVAVSAGQLAAALDHIAETADRESRNGHEESEALAKAAAHARDEQMHAERTAAGLEVRARELGKRLVEFDAALEALRTEGAVESGEKPVTALARIQATDSFLRRRTEEVQNQVGTIESTLDEERRKLTETGRSITVARSSLELVIGERDGLLGTIAALAGEGRLEALIQADVDPVGMIDTLLKRLEAEIRRADRSLIAIGVEGAEDTRALEGIDADGLLPPQLDLCRALELLATHQVPAVAGWTYLADVVAPERRVEAFLAAPLLAGAVLVQDPALLGKARQLLEDADLRPSSVIAIGTTADLDGAGESDALALPMIFPNPSLYDRSHARDERQIREAAKEAREELDRAIAVARTADRALVTRLESLVLACPPGHLDELSRQIDAFEERLRILEDAELTAGSKIEDLVENIGHLGRELLRGAEDRRRLAGFAARLTWLAGQSEGISAERREASEIPTGLQVARERAQAEKDRAKAAQQASSDSHDRAVRLAGQARDCRDQRRALPPETVPVTPPDGISMDTLRTAFATADQAWRQATSESVVAGELRSAEATYEEAAKPLQSRATTLVAQARDLLVTSEGSTQSGRDEATRAARSTHMSLVREQGECEGELKAADQEVLALESRFSGERDRFRTVEMPASRDEALINAAHWESEQQSRSNAMSAARERADAARGRRDEMASLTELLLGQAMAIDLSDDPEPRVYVPFAGTAAEAKEAARASRNAMKVAYSEAAKTGEAMRQLSSRTLYWANQAEFQHVAAEVRERFVRSDYAAETGPDSGSLRRQFEISRDGLAAHLGRLEEHRENVVSRAIGLVRIALRDIERFSRLSEVPEGLAGWTGHRFVDVSPRTAPDLKDPVMRDRIGRAVDSIIDRRSTIDGLDLLWRSLDAVVAEGGFRARVLKPSASLALEHVSIELMGKWSGGEKVTAAILLFTTVARLRAANRGRTVVGGAGALMLDNPVGKANYVGFLQLQIKIAEAAGVQLVFFTGISDLRSIDRFPNILRMRNSAAGDRQYVRTGDREQDESALQVARGQRVVEPAQLFPA